VTKYVRHQLAEGKRRHSYMYLEKFWKPQFKGWWLQSIRTGDIEDRLDAYAHEHKLRPASRNNILGQLSGLFNYARRRDWVEGNPCRDIPKLKVRNARTRWIRPQELDAILEHCEPWLADLVNFSIRTGLRLGETLSLRVGDYSVDAQDRAFLTVRETKNGCQHHVPVEGSVRELVERLIRRNGLRPRRRLFAGPRGGNPYSSVRRHFKAAVTKAGLPWGERVDGITWHSLRHSMASLALNAGVSESVVMRLGNWRSRSMVARYGHLADDTLRKAASKLDDLL
jgi:integrase